MVCSVNALREKEVINIKDGARLGFVGDVEVDLDSGQLISVIIPGSYKLAGLFGREQDVIIKWEDIKKIGDDLIIVEM